MDARLRVAAIAVASTLLLAHAASSIAEPQHPGVRVSCSDFRTAATVDVYAERVTAAGEVHAAWVPDPSRLCLGTGRQFTFASAADGSGGAFVAWVEPRAQGSDIRVQRLAANGAPASGWTASGAAICGSPRDQYAARVIADGAGGAFVAWQDFRGSQSRVYVRRVGSTGTFSAGWQSDGVGVSNAGGEQSAPVLLSDGAGGAFAIWQEFRNGTSVIRVQRLTAGGALAAGWPSDGRVACASTHAQHAPAATGDGAGGLIVVWSEKRTGSESGLYAIRLTADGLTSPGWPANGVSISSGTDNRRLTGIVGDGAGGAFVAWCGSGDIFVQRISGNGAIASGWPAAGLGVCTGNGEQYAPALLADGVGGAFVAWEDYRASDDGDIYAQRVTSLGAAASGWPANGVLLCDAAGAQFAPALSSDGAGGAIATWFDARSSAIASFTSSRGAPGAPSERIAFALHGTRPSPARGAIDVSFALPDGSPARLELLDVQGRRMASRDVGGLGPGRHVVNLAEGKRLRAGVYLLRLTRAGQSLTSSAVVVP